MAAKGPAGRAGAGSGVGRRDVTHADAAMAALSRQLVQAKMAEADAQRKHRYKSLDNTNKTTLQGQESLCLALEKRVASECS